VEAGGGTGGDRPQCPQRAPERYHRCRSWRRKRQHRGDSWAASWCAGLVCRRSGRPTR
jgi:hypothetical protein